MLIDAKLKTKSNGDVVYTDRDGKEKKASQSDYQPDERTRQRIAEVHNAMTVANEVRNKPYRELNDLSLTDRMNVDQQSFQQYVEPESMDPEEAWKSRAFRPIVRNKVIAIAAHVTAAILYPAVFAQNKKDEEDRDAAAVMSDIMEWVNDRSNYDETFINAVMGALVNPASFIYTEFAERFRFERDGKDVKVVLDELMSGIQDLCVPCDEIWVTDFYESDIQKQPVVIWRRVVSYEDAKTRYANNKNFKEYVQPGLHQMMTDDALFYESWDRSLTENQVEEIIMWKRTEDLRLVFCNGVLLTDADEPNPRKDKLVPIAKLGYENLDEAGRSFYYKSLVFKLGPDEEVVNTLYRMVIDGTYLQLMPPAVAFGAEDVGTSVMIPGAVTTFSDPVDDPKSAFQTINTGNNLQAGYAALEKVEASISESSTPEATSGNAPQGVETAYEFSRLEQNARTLLGLFGKMLKFAVEDWGYLHVGDIVQHLTVGEAIETMDGSVAMKFNNFLLPEKKSKGKSVTRRIEFDMNMPSDDIDEETLRTMSRNVREEERKSDDKQQIMKVNPELFRELKYSVKIKAVPIIPMSPAMEKAMKLQTYAMGLQNPMIDVRPWTRDLFLSTNEITEGDPDQYLIKEEQMQPATAGAPKGKGGVSKGLQDAVKAEEGVASDMKSTNTMMNIK